MPGRGFATGFPVRGNHLSGVQAGQRLKVDSITVVNQSVCMPLPMGCQPPRSLERGFVGRRRRVTKSRSGRAFKRCGMVNQQGMVGVRGDAGDLSLLSLCGLIAELHTNHHQPGGQRQA